jgi:hypothetical protein
MTMMNSARRASVNAEASGDRRWRRREFAVFI